MTLLLHERTRKLLANYFPKVNELMTFREFFCDPCEARKRAETLPNFDDWNEVFKGKESTFYAQMSYEHRPKLYKVILML